MFNFLANLRRKSSGAAVVLSQRERFESLVLDLNSAIDELADKPRVTLDPSSGHISFDLPEQFPDEALALPAPEEAAEDKATEDAEGHA